jgi:hypothetical protein
MTWEGEQRSPSANDHVQRPRHFDVTIVAQESCSAEASPVPLSSNSPKP